MNHIKFISKFVFTLPSYLLSKYIVLPYLLRKAEWEEYEDECEGNSGLINKGFIRGVLAVDCELINSIKLQGADAVIRYLKEVHSIYYEDDIWEIIIKPEIEELCNK